MGIHLWCEHRSAALALLPRGEGPNRWEPWLFWESAKALSWKLWGSPMILGWTGCVACMVELGSREIYCLLPHLAYHGRNTSATSCTIWCWRTRELCLMLHTQGQAGWEEGADSFLHGTNCSLDLARSCPPSADFIDFPPALALQRERWEVRMQSWATLPTCYRREIHALGKREGWHEGTGLFSVSGNREGRRQEGREGRRGSPQ